MSQSKFSDFRKVHFEISVFSWPGRSPGRAIVLPPASVLASVLASVVASVLAKC